MLSLTQLVCRASRHRRAVVELWVRGLNHSVTLVKPAALVGPIVGIRTVKYSAYVALCV